MTKMPAISRSIRERVRRVVCNAGLLPAGLRHCTRWQGQGGNWFAGEGGASLVEMAIAVSIYLSLFFGVIEISLALYAYNFVSDAAREATRYTVIRGADSCYPNSAFPNCNLQPSSITSTTNPSGNPVLQYIESLQYPGLSANNLSATVTWWVATQNSSGNTSWTTACTGSVDANGNACNAEGNAVKVVVTYNFPLSIPWVQVSILKVSSTSQMVINF